MIDADMLLYSMGKITEYLKKSGMENIELTDDLYLDIADEKFDVYSKNTDELKKADICIGSVSDDIAELKKNTELPPEDFNAVSFLAIERLAHILEYVAYYIRKEKKYLP